MRKAPARRHMGLLRSLLEENEDMRRAMLLEMLARTAKRLLRRWMVGRAFALVGDTVS
jgi:hypothetical protein